jgi:pimeloyl-ACP methyl ester carboxylesterase
MRRTTALKAIQLFVMSTIALAIIVGISSILPGNVHASQSAARGKEPSSQFVKLDDVRVHYRSYGKAGNSALVFIHGWTCHMGFWRSQIPAFSDKVRVIAIDLPGHGQSDKPQIAYTMDLFARAIDVVLRDAGVTKAVLAGHSMGVPVIRQFYRKYPEKSLALVLVDGSLRPFGDKKMMETFIAPLRGPNYKEVATSFIQGMLGSVSPALQDEIKGSMLSTPQHVAVSAMEGMAEPEIWTQDKIKVPTLAVLAKSPFWPPDNEQFMKGIAPHLDYHMWDGVSHFLMMEKPTEFNSVVSAFLAKNNLLQ